MERLFKDKPARKLGGGLKDRPQCERCGRPVKVTRAEFARDEVLCSFCASEANASAFESYESGRMWA